MKRAAPLLLFVVPLGLWAGLTETGALRHRAVAGPVATWAAFVRGLVEGGLIDDVSATAWRVSVGVLLGALVGLPLGVFVGLSKERKRVLDPGLDFLRAIPPLLVFPLLLLAFGYDDRARIGVVAWAAALVISLYVTAGVGRSRRERLRALRAMGATRWQTLKWLHLYEVLPSCLTALRHAVATGIVVAVVTEMVVGVPHGLGARAVAAQIAYDTPELYAVILTTGAIGYVVGRLLSSLERRLVFWQE